MSSLRLYMHINVCTWLAFICTILRWRHNGRDCVSNHQPHSCLLNRLFGRRAKKTSKLRVTGLCVGNSPGTGEFPAQMASNAENVSIWWRHHDIAMSVRFIFIYSNHPFIMMMSSNGNIFRVTGLGAGNSPVTGEFPSQRVLTRSIGVFFDLRLNKRLSQQSWGWWFETPSHSL